LTRLRSAMISSTAWLSAPSASLQRLRMASAVSSSCRSAVRSASSSANRAWRGRACLVSGPGRVGLRPAADAPRAALGARSAHVLVAVVDDDRVSLSSIEACYHASAQCAACVQCLVVRLGATPARTQRALPSPPQTGGVAVPAAGRTCQLAASLAATLRCWRLASAATTRSRCACTRAPWGALEPFRHCILLAFGHDRALQRADTQSSHAHTAPLTGLPYPNLHPVRYHTPYVYPTLSLYSGRRAPPASSAPR